MTVKDHYNATLLEINDTFDKLDRWKFNLRLPSFLGSVEANGYKRDLHDYERTNQAFWQVFSDCHAKHYDLLPLIEADAEAKEDIINKLTEIKKKCRSDMRSSVAKV